MKFILISILFFFASNLIAQNSSIEGNIYDATTKYPIEYASVRLLHANDSSFVKGTESNIKGYFYFSAKAGTYLVKISYLGYKDHWQSIHINNQTKKLTLNKIALTTNDLTLSETTVIATPPAMQVKGDTIEFNASSFKVGENDVLNDLIRKIPGITIDAYGNISANGKPITKIMVDGKEFFGNNVDMALKNLPANMISQLQLFKEESDIEKLTGVKNGDEEEVLNLKVKKEITQSLFGNIESGYGSSKKYTTKSSINYMHNKTQLAAIVDLGNTGDQYTTGIETKKDVGLNFNTHISPRFEIEGNFQHNQVDNTTLSRDNNETFLSAGNRFTNNNATRSNNQKTTSGNLNLKWTPDSLTTIYYRGSYSHNTNANSNQSNSQSYIPSDTTIASSMSFINGYTNTLNSGLSIGRKLNNKGRRISFQYKIYQRSNNSAGENHSITQYSLNNEIADIDQRTKGIDMSTSWSTRFSYVEPFGKTKLLELSYSYAKNNLNNNQETFRKDPTGQYTVIDSAYTRNTINKYTTQNIGVDFQSSTKKYLYVVGFHLIPSISESDVLLGDSLIDQVKQSIVNYSPSVRFTYRPNQSTNIEFNYYGTSIQPSLRQLSADTISLNSMNKTYGNPALKSSFSNSLTLYYQKSNFAKKTFLLLSADLNFKSNSIADYTLVDALGNTYRSFRNVDGNLNSNFGFAYHFPIHRITVGTSSNLYYSRVKGFTNTALSTTNSYTAGESIDANYAGDNLIFFLQGGLSHTITDNKLSSSDNLAVTNFTFKANVRWNTPSSYGILGHLSFVNDLNYALNMGYSSEFAKNYLLWNISLEKHLLKQQQLTVKAYLNNLLNNTNNVTRSSSSNGVSYSWTNAVSRYFLFSISYRFRFFKKGEK